MEEKGKTAHYLTSNRRRIQLSLVIDLQLTIEGNIMFVGITN